MRNRREPGAKHLSWVFIFPVIGFMIGLGILAYPAVTEKVQEYRNEQAISSMTSTYDWYADNSDEIERELLQAHRYNEQLASGRTEVAADLLPYDEQLTLDGGGVMGYVYVPRIGLKMLIYHGTSDEVLAAGAGHVENTSLPVGGSSTHTVLTGHSGMKNMRAFDDLRQLESGDLVGVTVLGKTLAYRVTSSEVVLPEETDNLLIQKGQDLLTLVTCTPYGINDHRLLVHAERISDAVISGQGNTATETQIANEIKIADENEISGETRTANEIQLSDPAEVQASQTGRVFEEALDESDSPELPYSSLLSDAELTSLYHKITIWDVIRSIFKPSLRTTPFIAALFGGLIWIIVLIIRRHRISNK